MSPARARSVLRSVPSGGPPAAPLAAPARNESSVRCSLRPSTSLMLASRSEAARRIPPLLWTSSHACAAPASAAADSPAWGSPPRSGSRCSRNTIALSLSLLSLSLFAIQSTRPRSARRRRPACSFCPRARHAAPANGRSFCSAAPAAREEAARPAPASVPLLLLCVVLQGGSLRAAPLSAPISAFLKFLFKKAD